MSEQGMRNPENGIETIGLTETGTVRYNLTEAELHEFAMQRSEAKLTADGVLVAYTGQHTGRSPKDKFVVDDALTADSVWWENNGKMSKENFDTLLADLLSIS